jgi:hypothetical protein
MNFSFSSFFFFFFFFPLSQQLFCKKWWIENLTLLTFFSFFLLVLSCPVVVVQWVFVTHFTFSSLLKGLHGNWKSYEQRLVLNISLPICQFE